MGTPSGLGGRDRTSVDICQFILPSYLINTDILRPTVTRSSGANTHFSNTKVPINVTSAAVDTAHARDDLLLKVNVLKTISVEK